MRPVIGLLLLAVGLQTLACGAKKKVTRDDDADEDEDRPSKRSKKKDKDSDTASSSAPASGGAPTFKLSGVTWKTGETIDVTFDRPIAAPETQQYWITLVEASQPDTAYGSWHYLKNGVTSDKLVPTQTGDYEVRFYDLFPSTKNKVLSRQRVSIVECKQASDCPGTGPLCESGKCVGAGSSPVPIEPAGPNDYAADGWPAVMPPPPSKAPTTDEWNAVPREVNVKGSGTLKCETKVVREWLRVSCHENNFGVPLDVTHVPAFGQQAFTFVSAGSVTSAVVQMIPGKTYTASFTWSGPGGDSTYKLTATWINNRPYASFEGF